jgi:uncharacterized protein YceH (UPF0502 family)
VHRNPLSAAEQRVLGCLIEKRYSTPDQYPLTLNSLRLACNQATNRDPVVCYDEDTVHAAAQRLCQYGLARLATGHTSRAIKYRHLAEEALGLDREQLALLAVLLLRGAQTPGELKARAERLAQLGSLEQVERVLGELMQRGYAQRLPRPPGRKEDRYAHALGESSAASEPIASSMPGGAPADGVTAMDAPAASALIARSPAASAVIARSPAPDADSLARRVAALEAQVGALARRLEEELSALRAQLEQGLGAMRGTGG